MPKASEEDKTFFRSLIPGHPGVEIKPMFGNLDAFVHGNMFAGLFGASIGVKLDDAGLAELTAIDGSGPFGPAERPMGGYTSLPEAWRATPEVATQWMERALEHVGSLPPKAPKPKKAAATKTAKASKA
jgi:TfoX/Sxy family transcriptional regulator of competence genes